MAKNENLRSVFDWIQIQFNTFDFSLEEIVEDILFLDTELFVIDKGSLKYYEYDSQINYGNIRIYYGDKEESFMLVMSGQALEFYRDMVLTQKGLSERHFLDNLYSNYKSFSVRRIDIAIDDFNEVPYFTPNQLAKLCRKNRFLYGKSNFYTTYGDEKTGQTLYLRRPSDDERLRIYDKRLEQASKLGVSKRFIENWIRTELELRKEKAHYFIQEWLKSEIDILNFTKGYLKDKVKFYTDSHFTKPLRSWEKFLGSSKPVTITVSKTKTELEQKLEWVVFKGSGAILRAYKFLYENELLFELEKENFEKLETLEFPPELASQLIERAIAFKREDLIPKIKENIKRRNLNWTRYFQNLKQKSELMKMVRLSKIVTEAKDDLILKILLVGNITSLSKMDLLKRNQHKYLLIILNH